MGTHGPKASPPLKRRCLLAPAAVRLRFRPRSPSRRRPHRDRPPLRRRLCSSRPQRLLFAPSWPNTTKPLPPLQPRPLRRLHRGRPWRRVSSPAPAPGGEGPARPGAGAVGPRGRPAAYLAPGAGVVLVVPEGVRVLVPLGPRARHVPSLRAHPPGNRHLRRRLSRNRSAPPPLGSAASPLARRPCLYNPLPTTVRYVFAASRPPSLRRGA